MNQLKRKLSFDDLSQKLESQSTTCFEDFSSEYFYEIFEYLESCEVYKTFSKLNSRFQQIVDNSWFLFRIEVDSSPSNEYLDYFHHILTYHRRRIYSINSFDMRHESIAKLFYSIDSSCDRLEAISFFEIQADVLIPLLRQYSCLLRLFSFDIDISDRLTYNQTIEIYRLIFSLPKLKSLRFATSINNELFSTLPLSIATKEQYTHIQYLYLDHCMDLNELFSIISYTPKVSQLIASFVLDNKNSNLKHQIRIPLFNLKYFSIKHYEGDFVELEEFFWRINCQLDIFNLLIRHREGNYHHVYQWQRFIQKYLSYSKSLTLTFQESDNSKSQILNDTLQLKQICCSSLWFQRRMNFEIEISSSDIKHTISPYRYEYKQINSSMKLCLTKIDLEKSFSLVISHIQQILLVTTINHLQIKNISIGTLRKILALIPELDSLKMFSLLINENDTIEIDQNYITKVYLGKLNGLKQIDLLLKIFPHMNYFQLDSTKNINIQVCFRYIINKINTISNHQLRFVCFHVSAADDWMIQILRMMIQSEKLLFYYTIKRILNHIYVGWK